MRQAGRHRNDEQLWLSGRLWNNSGSQWEAAINKETPWVQRKKIHFQGGGHSNRVLFVTPLEWSFLKLEISADYPCRKEMLSSAFWRQLTLFEVKTKPSDSLGLFIQLHSSFLLFISGSGVSSPSGAPISMHTPLSSLPCFPPISRKPKNVKQASFVMVILYFCLSIDLCFFIHSSVLMELLSAEPDSWRSSFFSWAWWHGPVISALHKRGEDRRIRGSIPS